MYTDHMLRNKVLEELHALDISMQQEDVSLNGTSVVSKHPDSKKRKHFNHINSKRSHPFSFPFLKISFFNPNVLMKARVHDEILNSL